MAQLQNNRSAKSWQKKKRRKFSFKLDLHKKKKTINKRTVLLFFGILLLFTFVYLGIYSEPLRIKTVSISGNENIAGEKLQEAVENDLAEKVYGIIPGDSYLFVNKEKLRKKLIENFTEIENVEVGMKFPNEIILNVKEKKTALIWCRNNQCYFVNDKGAAFLLADEGQLVKEQKIFVKIIEEAQIAEETEAERQAMQKETGDTSKIETTNAKEGIGDDSNDNPIDQNIETTLVESSSILPAIILNEQVSDEAFVNFAVEINGLISHNTKMKIMYFKTKGYKTRELIAFTDKNTKLYFDTTKSAQKQAKNLDYFLNEAIDKEKIDSLQYVYLKNEDRVFYK